MMDVILSDLSAVALAKAEAKNLACYVVLRPDASPAFGELSMTSLKNTCEKPLKSVKGRLL
jgi:hypothetical protein